MSVRTNTSTTGMDIQETLGSGHAFADHRFLADSIRELDQNAIRHLHQELTSAVKSVKGIYLLSREDIDELKNDALLITIRRLQEGLVLFDGTSVVGYARGVMVKLLQNHLRRRQLETVELLDHDQHSDFDPEAYLLQKETESEIGRLLKSLGGVCEKIIRLRYFDNIRDQEVVDLQLVAFSNVDSLKSKRCSCLKKLADIAKKKGITKKP